ncbi:lytic transglycosylase domain-containing protein [Devosia soli]|uniref:transglycosylase SLT domain-containing protein n=1 Tax=Devosia soli TaxID=361041 RepID=UPI000A05B18F
MMARALPLAGTIALAVLVSGCSMAGIKPLPGNKSATAALASFAPATPTPAGHVPDAANVPRAGSELLLGFAESERGSLDGLISHYSNAYNVPESLVRRIIVRESGYNPAARNGPYYGLMQISYATARGMGYSGEAAGLLDAETNLRYAVRYLAGAYVTANNSPDRAVQLYASGYYYDAKRQGLLEKAGLR